MDETKLNETLPTTDQLPVAVEPVTLVPGELVAEDLLVQTDAETGANDAVVPA